MITMDLSIAKNILIDDAALVVAPKDYLEYKIY